MAKILKIIITQSTEKELRVVSKYFSEEHIKKAAIKVYSGLGVHLSVQTEDAEMRKIYLTSPSGAGRALFLLQKFQNQIVLILIRIKNDKIGKNMSYQNPEFVALLDKKLPLILQEIIEKKYRILKVKM